MHIEQERQTDRQTDRYRVAERERENINRKINIRMAVVVNCKIIKCTLFDRCLPLFSIQRSLGFGGGGGGSLVAVVSHDPLGSSQLPPAPLIASHCAVRCRHLSLACAPNNTTYNNTRVGFSKKPLSVFLSHFNGSRCFKHILVTIFIITNPHLHNRDRHYHHHL